MEVINIGIPPEAEIYAGPGDLRLALKPRFEYSHKGENGRLLVVGGSSRYVGAPSLTAMAALKVGVDLTVVAVPYSITSAVRAYSPDLITVPLPAEGVLDSACIPAILREALTADAVVLGMGLGLEDETKTAVIDLVNKLNESGKPMVIDADALKALGGVRKELTFRNVVLTPHSGEFLALTGNKLPDEKDVGWEGRLEIIKRWAKSFNATILLKSRYDIITDGQRYKIKTIGNPGLTTGGTGDVLAGIVGALLSKGESPLRSAVGGSFLNSYAGDLLESEMGQHFTAEDLVGMLPVALKSLGM
jgi:NAD(P)H-hydrate epimerase